MLLALQGCAAPALKPPAVPAAKSDPAPPGPVVAAKPVVISVLGTNDVHGRLGSVAYLSGYVDNLRAARGKTQGGVLLLDAGDIFQGTLESNLVEGASMVRAYNLLGYDAVTVGNHEFDFGPLGPRSTPEGPADDARGALKALAAQAKFPFLMANVVEAPGNTTPAWPNIVPSTLLTVAGVRVGLVGVTTIDTPRTTIATNFAGLAMLPMAEAIKRESQRLKGQGAQVVIVLAHAGSKCARFSERPQDDECELDAEIVPLAAAVQGHVDLIVGGHTHAGVAHRFSDIPVIESFSYGQAFGRVDLEIDPTRGKILSSTIFAPQRICKAAGPGGTPGAAPAQSATVCETFEYEGAAVTPKPQILEAVRADLVRADALRQQRLGPVLSSKFTRAHGEESAVGNLFAELLLRARGGDVALANGGGLRADLPEGPLTFGALFEAFPFDNRVATVRLSGAELKKNLLHHLVSDRGGIVSVAGVRVTATCTRDGLRVEITRESGARIRDDEQLTLVTSDFIVLGGDDVLKGASARGAVTMDDELVRDAMIRELGKRSRLAPADFLQARKPRIALPAARPIRCPE